MFRSFFLSLFATGGLYAAEGIEPLLEQLSHPRYSQREAAMRAIEAIGMPALKELKPLLTDSDLERRQRAQILYDRIERQVNSAKYLVVPKVRFRFEKKPLDECVAEVSKIVGIPYILKTEKDRKREITLDTGELPVWQALDAFLQAVNMQDKEHETAKKAEDPLTSGRRIINRQRMTKVTVPDTMMVDGLSVKPSFNEGAFRIRFDRILEEQRQPGRPITPMNPNDLTLMFHVEALRTLPLDEFVSIEVTKATSDDQRVLKRSFHEFANVFLDKEQIMMQQRADIIDSEMFTSSTNASSRKSLPVHFNTEGLVLNEIRDLEGYIVAKVRTPVEVLFQVKDVFNAGKSQSFKIPNQQVTIIETRNSPTSSILVVRMRIEGNGPQDQEAMLQQLRNQVMIQSGRPSMSANSSPFRCLKADKTELRLIRFDTSPRYLMNADGTMQVEEIAEVHFAKPEKQEPLTLEMVGSKSVIVEMPFRIKNIPIDVKK